MTEGLPSAATVQPAVIDTNRFLWVRVQAGRGVPLSRLVPVVMLAALSWSVPVSSPPPTGRLVDAGGHALHLSCTGEGAPTVVVENGLGDFSFDWILVQRRVERFARICTYDRAGYAWSEPGPFPRTFNQLNLELRAALARAGERGPYVLVGHSFGGGVVRHFAERYPDEVAGLVLAEAVAEDQYVRMGPHAGRIRDDARGIAIPEPKASFTPPPRRGVPGKAEPLESRLQSPPTAREGAARVGSLAPGLAACGGQPEAVVG